MSDTHLAPNPGPNPGSDAGPGAGPTGAGPTDAGSVTPMVAGALLRAPTRDPASLDPAAIRAAYDEHGAVLIAGADIDRQAFVDLTERFEVRFMEYVGGANNDRGSAFKGSTTVLTVTGGAVLGQAIPLHGEMFYTQPRPRTLFFGCIRPADADGQTTICDGVKLWAALPDDVRALFEERRVSYRRLYADDAWKKVYKTDSLDTLRDLCAASGVTLTENADGSIETLYRDHAYAETPAGRAFINSVLVWASREYIAGIKDSQVRWEDGSEIDKALLFKVNGIAEQLTLDVPWEPGMVAVVDNFRVMHGRRGYKDAGRDIIMRLGLDPLGDAGGNPARTAAE